jgi:hypothetical protein
VGLGFRLCHYVRLPSLHGGAQPCLRVAVLFLPPTLVGTVCGMNFEHMPKLGWLFGYPFALVLMVVSAIAPYYWFKHRGWLSPAGRRY